MPDIKYGNQNRHNSCHQTNRNTLKISQKSNNWLSCQSLYICYTQSCKFCMVFGEHLYNCQFSAVCFLELSFLKGGIAYVAFVDILFKKN